MAPAVADKTTAGCLKKHAEQIEKYNFPLCQALCNTSELPRFVRMKAGRGKGVGRKHTA